MSFLSGLTEKASGVFRVESTAKLPRATAKEAPEESGESSEYAKYSGQDFYKLRSQLYASGKLFEDPEFPANDRAIYFTTEPSVKVVWKRPHEFMKDPRFFVGGASRFDIEQGALGDCWLLSTVASLTLFPELFARVVPSDQDFLKDDKFKYAGIFHFRFWQYGTWTDVVVDDLLPTNNGQLVYMHSKDQNELWSALLEKAYAKLFGSYESLKGGSSGEAMVDFTGGMVENIDLREKTPPNLKEILKNAMERSCLMGCSIDPDPTKTEAVLPSGLVMGHAYSVTNSKEVKLSDGSEVALIRCRNPWGNDTEWNGAWSDSSSEWKKVSKEEREQLGITFEDDGEFWMSLNDFTKNFQHLEICHMGADSLQKDELKGKKKARWEQVIINGAWVKRVSAGGCRNFINTFWTNPQFRVKVEDPAEQGHGSLVLGVMQKDRRKKKREGAEMLTIGYIIYQVKPNSPEGILDITFFKRTQSFARCPAFTNAREVCSRHTVPTGEYVIVPSTFEPNFEADFILRLYTEHPASTAQADTKSEMKLIEPAAKAVSSASEQKATEAIRAAFTKLAGEDMEVDAYELRAFLNAAFKKDFPFDGFSLECCRSMLALYDADLSGKLGLDEFTKLWTDLRLYKAVFKQFDADKSGKFNSYEMREALKALGLNVSNRAYHSLVLRYADPKGDVSFDDFILIVMRTRTVFENFKAQKKDKEGSAVFSLDDFIHIMIYL